MNKETLKTIFSPYGDIIGCEVNDEESMIEYVEEKSLDRAITALHGFHIGTHRLSVQLLKNEVQTEAEIQEEAKVEAKVEEKEENRKLVVGNWPIAMGEGLLNTLFSPYGELKEAKIVNECAFVEYNTKEDAEKAYNALNGFQMGANKLIVSFASDEISHILSMNNNGNINGNININEEPVQIIPEIDEIDEEEYENSENSGEFEIEIENNKELVDEFQRIGYPVNDDMEAMEAIIEVVEINNDDGDNDNESPPPPVRKKSIFEQDEENENDNENENENETENMQHLKSTENIELEFENKSNEKEREKERERVENEQETPNENDIEQMVLKENDKEIQQMYANEHNKIVQDAFNAEQFIDSNKHKKTVVIIENENENENEQDSSSRSESDDNTDSDSSISFESDSSSDDSSDSEKEKEKLKRKSSKKKLSKKQLKKLKKKQRRKKKRKMRKRKEKKKLAQREKYVDKNILALNECLDKFTNLMSSVSQSAMVMQQSVAQISQIHAQQQQQSIMYQQSINGGSIFPNQPMYTSIISNANMPMPNNTTQTQTQIQTQPGTSNDNTQIQSQSQSIQNIITQLSQTQGAPDNNAKTMSASPNINKPTPVNNANMLNQQQQQILLNQQLLQQQQQMMYNNNNNNNNKANAWIQSNFGKPTLNTNVNNNNNNITSSPILHSTQIMLNNNNAMNLSGDSNTEIQPGNMSSNPSKSKIFEHKKALRNVSKEMDEKLNALNEMGYKNRTFNLVLLKQENGDMDKVIENLKKFYENN